MIVSFKDPVTKLLHIVESSDISQIDDKTLKVFVDHHNMFVTLEFPSKDSLEIAIDSINKCEKMDAYSNNIEATISFQEDKNNKTSDIDIEMCAIDLSSLLDEDGVFDEESFLNQFLMDDDYDDEETDDEFS